MSFRFGRATLVGLIAITACADDPVQIASPADARAAFSLTGAAIAVNSLADPGDGTCDAPNVDDGCTLREAISAVDANGTITFSVTGTIVLGAGELVIGKPMTIDGPGSGDLVIDANLASRALYVLNAAPVTITDVTIRRGATGLPGGCIQAEGSTLNLTAVVVEQCSSQGAGGVIGSSGNNIAWGYLNLDRVSVRSGWAANGGGGIYVNHNSTMSMDASTVSGNEGREGGGVGATGYLTITNSTISGNRARSHGGGVYAADRGAPGAVVQFSTIVNNTSNSDNVGDGDGGGIFNSGGTLVLTGSIVAGNQDVGDQAPDCGAMSPQNATGSLNLIGNTTGCAAYAATAAVADVNPMLGGLGPNGGPTFTHLPLAGSPALDAAGLACPSTDQRGVSRPQAGACDIGSVEVVQVLTVSIDVRPGSATNPVSLRIGGTVPVAVLSSATFDATLVAVSSVRLEGVAVARRPNGSYMASLQDVNADGRLDLVLHFPVGQLGLATSSTSVTLTGELTAGGFIQGSDLVTIVP